MAVYNSFDIEKSHNNIRQKIIDDWRPIRPSPKTKWWYSTFHNVTAMVGAGVLSLPYAMAKLGWGPGIAVLLLSWLMTLYSLWQMVQLHEREDGKRLNRYHELGQDVFGKKRGLYIVVPQQLIVQVGVNIVYMVTGGESLQNLLHIVSGHHHWECELKLYHCIIIFAVFSLVISNTLPNYHSISWVSLIAAILSVTYSLIIFGACLYKGKLTNVSYHYKKSIHDPTTIFDFFSAMGIIAFAYAAHNIVLEIQATIPSHPGKPSKGPMWRGALVAYGIVAICYIPVAVAGYWTFGNAVSEDILNDLDTLKTPIAIANLFIFIHLIGSYQIYAMPIYDMMETLILKILVRAAPVEHNDSEQNSEREEASNIEEKPMLSQIYSVTTKFLYNVSRVAEDEQNDRSRPPPPKYFILCRFAARSLYVVATAAVAALFPYFVSLMAFFGGLALAPNSYFLPNIMWLTKGKKHRSKILTYIINSICITIGIILMILAATGSFRQLIVKEGTNSHNRNYYNSTWSQFC